MLSANVMPKFVTNDVKNNPVKTGFYFLAKYGAIWYNSGENKIQIYAENKPPFFMAVFIFEKIPEIRIFLSPLFCRI